MTNLNADKEERQNFKIYKDAVIVAPEILSEYFFNNISFSVIDKKQRKKIKIKSNIFEPVALNLFEPSAVMSARDFVSDDRYLAEYSEADACSIFQSSTYVGCFSTTEDIIDYFNKTIERNLAEYVHDYICKNNHTLLNGSKLTAEFTVLNESADITPILFGRSERIRLEKQISENEQIKHFLIKELDLVYTSKWHIQFDCGDLNDPINHFFNVQLSENTSEYYKYNHNELILDYCNVVLGREEYLLPLPMHDDFSVEKFNFLTKSFVAEICNSFFAQIVVESMEKLEEILQYSNEIINKVVSNIYKKISSGSTLSLTEYEFICERIEKDSFPPFSNEDLNNCQIDKKRNFEISGLLIRHNLLLKSVDDINKNSDIDFWVKDLKNCLNNIDLVLVSGFILKTDSFPTCSRNYFRETYRIYQSRVNDKYVNFEEWISSHENISLNKLSINDIFPK